MQFEDLSKKNRKIVIDVYKNYSLSIGGAISDAFNKADDEKEFENLMIDGFNHLLAEIYEVYFKITGNKVKPDILHYNWK